MKKIISSALLLLFVCVAANAAVNFKFYINPGHGGHDSDDRPTPQPNGVAIYYESDGNLERGLRVRDFLNGMGVTNAISRTANNSSDDLNLTYIATLSSNYQGYFWSLHSNGANASANYHVALYKGQNAANSISPSKTMAQTNSNWAYAKNLTNTTYGTPRGMADYDLMGWHYGVLRTNTQPGFLVEAWFHDYRPESLRMKSAAYEKFLAWQQVRSAMESPGGFGSKVLKGCIVGDVRDTSQGCGYSNYTSRGRDTYLALNGAKAELLNSSGAVVATSTVDNNHNGVWGFFDITAGTYTVKISKDGYKSDQKTFTVTNGTQQTWQVSLNKGQDTGISLNPTSTGFGQTYVDGTSSKNITITGTSLTANINITSSNTTDFTVSHSYVGPTGGTIKITYNPKSVGSHNTTLKFTSGSHSASMVVTGTAVNPPLTFTEGWNYSETSNKKAAWMANWTNYRNMAFGDGKLYVVDASNGVVKVLKAQTCEHLYDLDMTGVSGGALKLVDVAYVDGKLIGTNIAQTSNDDFKTLKVYIWDNDKAAPRVLLQTTNLGGMDRIGDTVNFQGTLSSGKICYFAQQTRDYTDKDGNTVNGNCNSLVTYAVTNGVASTTPVVADVDAFIAGSSPRAVPDGDNYWVLGQHYIATQINAKGQLLQSIPLTVTDIRQTSDGCGNDFVPFTFKGSQYAFTTAYNRVTDTNGDGTFTAAEINAQTLLGGRAVLIDGSQGWAVEGLKNSGTYPSAGLGSKTRNTTYSTSICVNVNGTSGVEMWVLVHNQGIAYYKHGTAPTYTYENVPSVSASSAALSFTTTEGHDASSELTISGSYLEGDITMSLSGTNADQFAISTSKIAQSNGTASGKVKVTYDPTAQGSHSATLTISSANATSVKVALTGKCNPNVVLDDQNIVLTEMWKKTTADGWFSLASPVTRSIAYKGGNLYVLNARSTAAPVINIVDAYTGAAKGTLSVDGVAGGAVILSNIYAFDGKIYASNRAAAPNGAASGTLKIYRWDSDTSAPTVIKEDATHGSVALGGKMVLSGNSTNGRIWFCNGSTVVYYDITNGTVGDAKTIALTKNGSEYTVGANAGESDFVINSDGSFWVDGKDKVPALFSASGVWQKDCASIVNGSANSFRLIDFGTRKLAAIATYMNKSATSLADGAFVLADVANGVDAATAIATYPETGFVSAVRNTQFMTTLCVATDRNDGMTLDVWYCVDNQGIGFYSYNGKKTVGVEDIAVSEEEVEMSIVKNGSTLAVAGVEAQAIAIYSMNGALVRMVNNANEVDVDGLNGMYIVAVADAQGVVRTEKVVIK